MTKTLQKKGTDVPESEAKQATYLVGTDRDVEDDYFSNLYKITYLADFLCAKRGIRPSLLLKYHCLESF